MRKMIKKTFCFTLMAMLAIIVFSTTQQAYASDIVNVTIDGQPQTFEVPPQIIDGRTMLPLRAVAEALNMTVDYDPDTHTATLTYGDTTITHRIGTMIIEVNGVPSTFDVPSVVIQERTLVPVRMLAEAIGADVQWMPETRTAAITTTGAAPVAVAPVRIDLTDAKTRELNEFFNNFIGVYTLEDFDITDVPRGIDTALMFAITYGIHMDSRGFGFGVGEYRLRQGQDFGVIYDFEGVPWEHWSSVEFISSSHVDYLLARFFGISNVQHRTLYADEHQFVWPEAYYYRDGRYHMPVANTYPQNEASVFALYDNGDGTLSVRLQVNIFMEGELREQIYNMAVIRPHGDYYHLLYWRNRVERNTPLPTR